MPATPTHIKVAPHYIEHEATSERLARILETALPYGLAGLLIFGPLAFGAVEDWARLVLQAGAALLLLLWAIQQALRARVQIASHPLYFPMLLFFLLVSAQFAFGLSAYRYATQEELLNYAAYGAMMFVSTQALQSSTALRRLIYILAIAGFVIAFFAIVQDFTANGKLYWLRTPRFGGWLFGPYVNHNHYAGLMEMLIPMPLAMGLHPTYRRGRSALLFFMATLMAASLFMSQSRAGVAAFAVEMVLFGVLVSRRERHRGAIVACLTVATLALLVWLNTTQVFTRLQEIHDVSRLQILRDGWRMFRERPFFGWGLGTFPTVYPLFRSFYTNLFINQAHNDFLQVLVETGLVGFALTLWFLGALYVRGMARARRWNVQPGGLAHLAALTGVSGLVVHSLFDFNLHIPANAALFYVLCMIAASGAGNRLLSPPTFPVATVESSR